MNVLCQESEKINIETRNGGLSRVIDGLFYSLSKADWVTERYATASTCWWSHLRLFSRVQILLWQLCILLCGSVVQGLGTTKFMNLISSNGRGNLQ